ncbi:hypothetical protein E4U41_003023 [Claviceps citrina]|nr:hypothetical protein E4U41_003023 [Claviceps citrina]
MSILTMAAPFPYHSCRNDFPWDISRLGSDASRPRTVSRQIALPSIRQAFPDLHLEGSLADVAKGRSLSSSSCYRSSPPADSACQTSPGCLHSPNGHKRRLSDEYEEEFARGKRVSRLYGSPEASQSRLVYPYRDQAPLAASDYWAGSQEYGAGISALPSPVEMASRSEARPALLSLPPTVQFDRDVSAMSRPKEHITELIHVHGTCESNHGTPVTADRPSLQSWTPEYGYAYHHPSRYQSLSTSSIRPHDRASFSADASHASPYQDMGRYVDVGMGGDAKQRKRRGNLPKETTDKLRAWFVAHLQHPYPTEDEKQDLMRQTGLQMNQISNWFINARRRQLPTMINNARVESDAMNSQSQGGKNGPGGVLKSTEHASEYVGGRRDDGALLSDGEGGAYEEDIHGLCRRRGRRNLERESV